MSNLGIGEVKANVVLIVQSWRFWRFELIRVLGDPDRKFYFLYNYPGGYYKVVI